MTVTEHSTYVAPSHREGAIAYRAVCITCGPFGPVCELFADARAIADRHTEIGGFERRPA